LPKVITRELDGSDAVILLVGTSGGSLAPDNLPWVIKEIEYATGKDKPIYAFRPRTLNAAAGPMMDMLNRLIGDRHIKVYESDIVSDFISCLPDIVSELHEHPQLGWVPASSALDLTGLSEISEALRNPVLISYLAKLSDSYKFLRRLSKNA